MRPFLSWWTDKETDERKVLLWNAMQNREKLLALLREAYEDGQASVPTTAPREPAAWLDPDAGKAITAAEKEATDTRHALWQHSYTVPLYR